jgi:hypothetical protein
MGYSAQYVSIYVVPYEECRPINGKNTNGRASISEGDQGKVETSKFHGTPVSIASDFSSMDTSQDILKSRKENRPQPTSPTLHPEPTSTRQPSGNWKQH